MKMTSRSIADATTQLLMELPEGQHDALLDAALMLLHRSGLSRAMRTFPRDLAAAFACKRRTVSAQLTLAAPVPTQQIAHVQSDLEASLASSVDLAVNTDPTLLGGASLAVGDERIDGSLRAQLHRLHYHLTSTPLPLSP